jgi:hypothetical protein
MKTIAGYSEYAINEDGTIIQRVTCESGKARRSQVKASMQKIKGRETGYLYCTLLSRDPNRVGNFRVAVHRLVALTWIGPPPAGKPWVNHRDGVKSNNHHTNLEWTSISENIQHAYNTGLHLPSLGMKDKQHSITARKRMSEAKKGTNHPKYKGYYLIDGKIFHSLQSAADQLLVSAMTIKRRIDKHEKGYKFINTEGGGPG